MDDHLTEWRPQDCRHRRTRTYDRAVFSSVIAVVAAVALVLPGFIVADRAETNRASRGKRTDWELVLRALSYALVLQTVVFCLGWTPQLPS